MAFWSVAQTESQREATAARWLERGGYEVYVPRIKVVRPRVEGRLRSKIRARIVPLFPGYIFVRIADHFYPVDYTIGVIGLLRSGEKPAIIRDDVVTIIRSQEKDGLVKLPEPKRLKRGDSVRVSSTRATFGGVIGIYEGMSGRDRVFVLLDLLGRKVRVDLPGADINPVA